MNTAQTGLALSEAAHPFRREGLAARAGPFAAVMALAIAAAPLPPMNPEPGNLVFAAVLTALIAAAVVLVPWDRLPRGLAAVPPLAYLVVVEVLRQPFEGATSGYAPLVILPVLWLALHGTRRELWLAIAGVGAIFLSPLLFVDFADSELRRAAVWVPVAVLVGATVQALVEHLRNTAAIVMHSDDAIVSTDAAGRLTRWNDSAERMFGYPAAEALGRSIELLSPAERVGEHRANVRRVLAGERVEHSETEGACADGSRFDVSLSMSPVPDSSGAVVGAAVVLRDVTDARSAERALRQAEERFRRAFEEAPIGMALHDLRGGFLEANPAMCAITGYSRAELESTTLGAITHPDDMPATEDGLDALVRGDLGRFESEERRLHAAGHSIWVSHSATLVRDVDGDPQHVLSQVLDVTDRRRYEDRLEHMAEHDPLTGLLNRRRFERELDRQVEHVKRYGSEGAVIVLDLDHFKYVNDTLGHAKGDELIVSVAGILGDRLRTTDQLARLGGDEFAVLLPKADASEAETVAQALVRGVREHARVLSGDRLARVTTSVGVALFEARGAKQVSGEDVIVNADLAMYEAKDAGRDRFALHASGEQARARVEARMGWFERIRTALEDEHFTLYAQPILDLQSHTVTRHELLLRLRDPNGDTIPPGAFLYIAERFDLIQAIDRWVAKRAIELVAELSKRHGKPCLEVNISGRSIGDHELLDTVKRTLGRTGVDPSCLVFEVTETAAVANIPQARNFAEQLAGIGCRFALDDFGAGFGSFYYLKHLPFDYLKIDGEFIRQCLTNPTDQLIIESVVGIARGLGKETIAEFVEDERTMRHLRRHGVDYAQGYHIGRPAPVDGLLAHGHRGLGQGAADETSEA